ncbi:MAG: hypothetical protein ACRCXM_17650 [Beijerinckiaceae bacterium]
MQARMKPLTMLTMIFGVAIGGASAARAQDASFGCKVLLCAAASNPAWRGIPYCVPVMTQLFALLRRKGASWPPCLEGRVSAPGYEPYQDCPAGWTPGRDAEDGWRTDAGGSSCARSNQRTASSPPSVQSASEAGTPGGLELRPRERRSEPWFVELDGEGGRQRFYYSLAE